MKSAHSVSLGQGRAETKYPMLPIATLNEVRESPRNTHWTNLKLCVHAFLITAREVLHAIPYEFMRLMIKNDSVIVAAVGSSIELLCEGTTSPPLTIKWQFENTILTKEVSNILPYHNIRVNSV